MFNNKIINKIVLIFIILLINLNNISYGKEYGKRKKIILNFLNGEMRDKYYLSGVKIKLNNDWKTYWKNPGNLGIKPKIIIKEKENIDKIEILWPVPEKLKSYDTFFYGYENFFIIPIKITPKDKSIKSILKLELILGLCKKICILETINIVSEINYLYSNFLNTNEIQEYLDRVPRKLKFFKKENVNCKKKIKEDIQHLRYEIKREGNLKNYEFAILDLKNKNYWVKKQESYILKNKIILEVELSSNLPNNNNIPYEEKSEIILVKNNTGIILNLC